MSDGKASPSAIPAPALCSSTSRGKFPEPAPADQPFFYSESQFHSLILSLLLEKLQPLFSPSCTFSVPFAWTCTAGFGRADNFTKGDEQALVPFCVRITGPSARTSNGGRFRSAAASMALRICESSAFSPSIHCCHKSPAISDAASEAAPLRALCRMPETPWLTPAAPLPAAGAVSRPCAPMPPFSNRFFALRASCKMPRNDVLYK